MKLEKRSDYANYLVLSDKSTFAIDGNMYPRKITSNEAKNILECITDCRWNINCEKIFLVSNQLGILI